MHETNHKQKLLFLNALRLDTLDYDMGFDTHRYSGSVVVFIERVIKPEVSQCQLILVTSCWYCLN